MSCKCLSKQVVGRLRFGFRPDRRRGIDQYFCLRCFSEADFGRSRAGPRRHFFSGGNDLHSQCAGQPILRQDARQVGDQAGSPALHRALRDGRGGPVVPAGLSAYLYVLFPIVGLTSVGQTPAAYSKAISAWFDRQRGLALGIALAGVGLGTAVIPQLSQFLIQSFGWRKAYVGLGIAIILLAFIPAALFVREPAAKALPKGPSSAPAAAGLTLREALTGSWRYWALTRFLPGAVSINGTLTQVVPLLTDRGFPIAVAVGALSGSGLAIIAGRIFSGYCLDKIFGPYVAIVFFLLPLAGVVLLYSGAAGSVPLIGTFLCGLGIGAEFDLMAFFVGRYFGVKSFGALYGLMFGVSQIGNAVGSDIMGWSFQILHSYIPALSFFIVALASPASSSCPSGPIPMVRPGQRPVRNRRRENASLCQLIKPGAASAQSHFGFRWRAGRPRPGRTSATPRDCGRCRYRGNPSRT